MNLRLGGRNGGEGSRPAPGVASPRSSEPLLVRKDDGFAGRPFPLPAGSRPVAAGRATVAERKANFPKTVQVIESTHQPSVRETGRMKCRPSTHP